MWKRRAHRPSQSLIVHLNSGVSIYGIVKAYASDCLILHSCRSLPDKQQLVGEVSIPYENIGWYQHSFPITMVVPLEPGKEPEDDVPVLASVS